MCKADKTDICIVASDESSYVTVCIFIPVNDALLTTRRRVPISRLTAVCLHAMLRRWANRSFLLLQAWSKLTKTKRMHVCNLQYEKKRRLEGASHVPSSDGSTISKDQVNTTFRESS